MEIAIAPVADDPILSASAPNGREDAPIALDLQAETGDPSEIVTVLVSGLPEGGRPLQRNRARGWCLEHTGNGPVTTPPYTAARIQWHVVAAGHRRLDRRPSHGAHNEVVADPGRTGGGRAGVGRRPGRRHGTEDHPVPLSLGLSMSDPSEEVAVRISGLPGGARLSAGELEPDGVWHLQAEDLAGLEFIPAPDGSGTFELSVTATTIDGRSEASTVGAIKVAIAAVAEQSTLRAVDVSGREDQAIPLDLRASSSDPSESVRRPTCGPPPRRNPNQRHPSRRWPLAAPSARRLGGVAAHSAAGLQRSVATRTRGRVRRRRRPRRGVCSHDGICCGGSRSRRSRCRICRRL